MPVWLPRPRKSSGVRNWLAIFVVQSVAIGPQHSSAGRYRCRWRGENGHRVGAVKTTKLTTRGALPRDIFATQPILQRRQAVEVRAGPRLAVNIHKLLETQHRGAFAYGVLRGVKSCFAEHLILTVWRFTFFALVRPAPAGSNIIGVFADFNRNSAIHGFPTGFEECIMKRVT